MWFDAWRWSDGTHWGDMLSLFGAVRHRSEPVEFPRKIRLDRTFHLVKKSRLSLYWMKAVFLIVGMLPLEASSERPVQTVYWPKALRVHWFLLARMRCCSVLVMVPGSCRFIDDLKVGVPLTLNVLLVLMVIMSILWMSAFWICLIKKGKSYEMNLPGRGR